MKPIIATWTGKEFDFSDPKPEMICIEDIAKALSCICRYTGHCNGFYSVAQHSVLMAYLTEFDGYGTPLQRLLHDSAEAYTGDIAKPWKDFLFLDSKLGISKSATKFATLEKRILKVIGEALDVDLSDIRQIKTVDNIMLATESRDLMLPKSQALFAPWIDEAGVSPLDYPMEPWGWNQSYEIFLRCYNEFKQADKRGKGKEDAPSK
jgi:hypothetical protein